MEFFTFVRTYNNRFIFTLFKVNYDRTICKRNREIYMFWAHGQIYRYIDDPVLVDGPPSYLQLYFYDTEHELKIHISYSWRLNPFIIPQPMVIFSINSYSFFFHALNNLDNLKNYEILIIFDTGLDQHVFNAPSSSQLVTTWIKSDNLDQQKEWDIMVFNNTSRSCIIQYYFQWCHWLALGSRKSQ